MLTGTTFEAVAILALIAVVHTVISTFIATRLSAGEKASGQTQAPRAFQPPSPRLSAARLPTISSPRPPDIDCDGGMVRIN